MNLKKIVKTFAISMLLAVTSTTANAQDLLARQAPVDRKMAAVDTIMLRNITMREELESPAADLYANWDNKYAHRATELPETFNIDLRHFTMPTTSRVITSNFGSRWGRQHKGLDIKVYIGDTIRAAFSGKVRIVRYERGGYGKYIVIRHDNGLETIYGHLSKQLVEENQEVRSGEVIGLGGNTGRSRFAPPLRDTPLWRSTQPGTYVRLPCAGRNWRLLRIQQTDIRQRVDERYTSAR